MFEILINIEQSIFSCGNNSTFVHFVLLTKSFNERSSVLMISLFAATTLSELIETTHFNSCDCILYETNKNNNNIKEKIYKNNNEKHYLTKS